MAPFAHDLAFPIALLPPLESVTRRAFLLIFRRLRNFAALMGAQLPMKSVQHFRNMIVELHPRKGGACRQLRVTLCSLAPMAQDRRTSFLKVGSERGELLLTTRCVFHRPCRARRSVEVAVKAKPEPTSLPESSLAKKDTLLRQTALGVSQPQRMPKGRRRGALRRVARQPDGAPARA